VAKDLTGRQHLPVRRRRCRPGWRPSARCGQCGRRDARHPSTRRASPPTSRCWRCGSRWPGGRPVAGDRRDAESNAR
jgi:hypothetical protein